MNSTDTVDRRGENQFNKFVKARNGVSASPKTELNGILVEQNSSFSTNFTTEYSNASNFTTVYEKSSPHITDKDDYGYTNGALTFSTDFGSGEASTVIDIPEKNSRDMTSGRKMSHLFRDKASRRPEAEIEDIDTWLEFTQTTTFHGIRYIFHPKNLRLRKYLWIMVVAAAVILFMYQVIDRANDYFSYRSNVNVEVVYETEMDFPSVTLCNQNNYRLTETVRRGMYSFIDGVYSGLTSTPDNHTLVGADDLLTFITRSAHQKQDLIDSCHWKGAFCDMDKDIVTTLTDFGVCYTFNPGHNGNILEISQSGSGFALSLVLNIEEYEYMKGPHDEAGMKVLLHDPSEVPLVNNLGFAIAPGTHTLVAVHREEIYSLQHPYGTCDVGAAPRSHCIAHCRAQDAVEICGCRDVHMPNITINGTDVEVCPAVDSYICLKDQKAALVTSGRACVCGIPCQRVSYTPELSYAHLSRLSVDKISLNDITKRQRLQQSYTDARETSHRVNEATVSADTLRYTTLLKSSQNYFQALTDSYKSIRDPDILYLRLGSRKNPIDSHEEIQSDLDSIKSEHARLWTIRSSNNTHPNLKEFDRLIIYIDAYVLTYTSSEPLGILRKVEECADLQAKGNLTSDEFMAECNTKDEPLATAMVEANPEQAESRPFAEPTARRFIKVLNTSLSEYEEIIRTLYENSTEWDDVITSPDHLECLDLLKNTTDTWIPKMIKVKNQFSAYYYTDSFAERRDISYDLWELSNWTKTSNDSLMRKDMFKVCAWYQLGKDAKDTAFQTYKQYMISVKNALLDSAGLINTLVHEGKSVAADYIVKSNFMFAPVREFMAHNRTKMGLYRHLESFHFKETLSGVEITNAQVQADTNAFTSRIQDIEYNLKEAFKYAFNFSVWVMRDDFVQDLKFINFIKTHYTNNHFVQITLPSLSYDNSSLLYGLMSHIFSDYRAEVMAKSGDVSLILSRLDDQVTDARDNLGEFEKGNQLNEQFFMDNYIKIDIFYKELSYNKISQQVSFEFISYLSEVGGFLGLLLGASVLTVCELVDYLTVASIKRCRTDRMK